MRVVAWLSMSLSMAGALLLAAGTARGQGNGNGANGAASEDQADAIAHLNIPAAPAASGTSTLPEPEPESPPPLPRHKGLVLDASLGVLGFGGQFRHVAPPGPWVHAQLGYELTDWLMIFGEGEVMFTQTSEAQGPSQSLAFDIWGFGGGLRATLRPTERFGIYLQGAVDALRADIERDGLVILGYRNAETLKPAYGGRLGLEWYQVDHHLALGLSGGVRDAPGFAEVAAAQSDTGLLWDASVSIRYTF